MLLFQAKNYLKVDRITGKSIGVYIMTERWIQYGSNKIN